MCVRGDLEAHTAIHPECEQGRGTLNKEVTESLRNMPAGKRDSSPHASGSSFRTVVVLSSAKKAPLCMQRKWLMYRYQFSFSATMVKPAACCKSRPVEETRVPVAKKFDNRDPMSKLTREKTFKRYRSVQAASRMIGRQRQATHCRGNPHCSPPSECLLGFAVEFGSRPLQAAP